MTQKTLFLAGASGAIGRRLAPMLVENGWHVVGTTRKAEKAEMLRELGVEPLTIDVFDSDRLKDAVLQIRPTIVIHQLTDLPAGLDKTKMAAALVSTARIRDEGTRNLVSAAVGAGVQKMIAQSICFAYTDGPLPHLEGDPLAINAANEDGVSARGVASLESQAVNAPLHSIVLRYGKLYGPGTGFNKSEGPGWLHIDAAAKVAADAVTNPVTGIFNIAEDEIVVSTQKAQTCLGFDPGWRSFARWN